MRHETLTLGEGAPIAFGTTHPVVLRFAELWPTALGRYEMHRRRDGGDVDHVDPTRSALNRVLIGRRDWISEVRSEIEEMRRANFVEELEALKAAKRKAEMDARIRESLRDPWRPSKKGPMREVILTANRKHFDGPPGPDGNPDVMARAEREEAFVAHAVSWLVTRFGDDVVHARVDLDETACHVHAIILPRATTTSKRRGRQRQLQPSIHPLLRSYEAAQDDVGVHFADLGLRRGERRAEAQREARAAGKKAQKTRQHVPTWLWRRAEDLRLHREEKRQAREREKLTARSAALAPREAAAEAIIAVAEGIDDGLLRLGRGKAKADPEVQPVAQDDPQRQAAARRLMDRIGAAPAARTRVVAAFSKVYDRMFRQAQVRAEAEAKARWAPQVARLTAALDQVERLRERVLGYLHPKRRTQVEMEFGIGLIAARKEAAAIGGDGAETVGGGEPAQVKTHTAPKETDTRGGGER